MWSINHYASEIQGLLFAFIRLIGSKFPDDIMFKRENSGFCCSYSVFLIISSGTKTNE